MIYNRCSGLSHGHNEKTICDINKYKIRVKYDENGSAEIYNFILQTSHHLLHAASCKMVLSSSEILLILLTNTMTKNIR